MLKKLGLVILSAVSAFAMHSAEININDKDLEIATQLDLGQFTNSVEPDSTYIGISYLNGSDDYSNADVDGYVEASFLMKREIKDSGVTFGIGLKTNYTKINDQSYMTIPLGLEVGYKIPVEIPVVLNAKVYYAPESLSFSKAESFFEYRVDASVEVIEKGSIILGYRSMDTNLENSWGTIHYNRSAYFGFKFAF